MDERNTICRLKSLYIVFFKFITKRFQKFFYIKHRKYRYNFIIYKLYRENLMGKVEDNYEQQIFLTSNDERKDIEKIFLRVGKSQIRMCI